MGEMTQRVPFEERRLVQQDVVANFFSTHANADIKGLWNKSVLIRTPVLRGVGLVLAAYNPDELSQQIGQELDIIRDAALESFRTNAIYDPETRELQIERVNAIFDGTIPDPNTISKFKKTKGSFFSKRSSVKPQTIEETATQIDYGRHLVASLRSLQALRVTDFSEMRINVGSAFAQLAYTTNFDGDAVGQDFNARVKVINWVARIATTGILKEQGESQSGQDTDSGDEAIVREDSDAPSVRVVFSTDPAIQGSSQTEEGSGQPGEKSVDDLLKRIDDIAPPREE